MPRFLGVQNLIPWYYTKIKEYLNTNVKILWISKCVFWQLYCGIRPYEPSTSFSLDTSNTLAQAAICRSVKMGAPKTTTSQAE
jgi:hypothetical protein